MPEEGPVQQFITQGILDDLVMIEREKTDALSAAAHAFVADPTSVEPLLSAAGSVMHARMMLEHARTIPIGTPEMIKRIDYVVGAPYPEGSQPFFPDNIVTECADCHQRIQLRPHAPEGPARVCLDCVMSRDQLSRSTGKES